MPSRRLTSFRPIWDDKDLPIGPLNSLDLVRVNGKPLKEFSKSNKVRLVNGNVVVSLKDLYGTLTIERPGGTEYFVVVPQKLFLSGYSPEDGERFIKETVLKDIGDFISFIVKEIRDIQAHHVFKIVARDYERSIHFLVVAMEHYLKTLEKYGTKLFSHGPVHKEALTSTSMFGSTVKYSYSNVTSPYLTFNRRVVTYDTYLNRMLFQSFYYIALESELLKHVVSDKYLIDRINNLQNRALGFIDHYHLWEFFYEAPLDMMELQNKLITQQNPYYIEIFRVYKELIKIVFSKTILENLEEGIHYPLVNFATIYETWAVWRIIHGFMSKGFQLLDEGIMLEDQEKFGRKTKAIFALERGDTMLAVVWELKFKPETDSLYMGSLLRLVGPVKGLTIKPDLVVLVYKKDRERPIKVLIGDVKFRLGDTKRLPPLESLYKILGYVLDLKDFDYFKQAQIEGLLIYPGRIEMVKIPLIDPKTGKDVFYLNLLPLNSDSIEIDIEGLLT